MTRMALTIHGRIDEGIFKFDRRLSSGRGRTNTSISSFRRILQQNALQTKQEESTIYSLISERPELRSMQTHECYESAMQKDNSRPQGSS